MEKQEFSDTEESKIKLYDFIIAGQNRLSFEFTTFPYFDKKGDHVFIMKHDIILPLDYAKSI